MLISQNRSIDHYLTNFKKDNYMSEQKQISIEQYNYSLPNERIAKYPLVERDLSKLLIFKNQEIKEDGFQNLSKYIDDETLLVFNNTKVIQARLFFNKKTGAKIEIFCLEPLSPSDFALMFQQKEKCSWKCIVGNLKKWKAEPLEKEMQTEEGEKFILKATRKEKIGDEAHHIEFEWNNENLTFGDILELSGITPIPPYLNRQPENLDKDRYQTIYSQHKGSVAAPTAGLHFTDKVFSDLKQKQVNPAYVTLHVGAGTFKPVKSETIGEHEMHIEHFSVNRTTLETIKQKAGRIITVGTTSVRSLESIYHIGKKIKQDKYSGEKFFNISQWEVYENQDEIPTCVEAIDAILNYMTKYELDNLYASTSIIIVPGYEFKTIKGLVTNFHQPKSTLLLLIAALIGDKWQEIYQYALENDFRFLSYGDSSLILP